MNISKSLRCVSGKLIPWDRFHDKHSRQVVFDGLDGVDTVCHVHCQVVGTFYLLNSLHRTEAKTNCVVFWSWTLEFCTNIVQAQYTLSKIGVFRILCFSPVIGGLRSSCDLPGPR